MKVIICLLFIFVASELVSAKRPDEKCVESTRINANLVKKMMKEKKLPDKPKVKQFMECFFVESGYLDAQNKANFDAIRKDLLQHVTQERGDNIMSACKDMEQVANRRENCYNVAKCVFDNVRKTRRQ